MKHIFEDSVNANRILRDIKIMQMMNHENVLGILDILPLAHNSNEFKDFYLVQDPMDTNLDKIIYFRQQLSIVQFFLYQILRGLKYMHSAKIIHRDLRPLNLSVNSDCTLKISEY